MVEVSRSHRFPIAKEHIMALFLEHEQLDRFFDAKFSIVSAPSVNNKQPHASNLSTLQAQHEGLIRKVSTPLLTFNEKVLAVQANLIRYCIIGECLISDHQGDIVFTENNSGCKVNYTIRCKAPRWFPSFLLKLILNDMIKKAFKRLTAWLNQHENIHQQEQAVGTSRRK
ncbi:hypothetical protein [Flocculibacter collagenilyticus]|uniref:hypothetical protein n=1 Tax=Flocculibacter collagenilyticus TaxID=2744479 RepID=UPI0018F5B955|nr:hypothetical protein [Flocculibacter collagenilyticus]